MTNNFQQGGDKPFSHTGWGTDIFTLRGDKHFCIKGGDKIFFVGGGGAYDDVDEEMDVREADIFVSKASKLSAGARIFRGP